MATNPSADAHNYFVQVAAELGLLGLACFLWLVAVPLTHAIRTVRRGPGDPRLTAILAGILAFIVTWWGGHPLLVGVVAYPFWLALGLAMSLARGVGPSTKQVFVFRLPVRRALAMLLVVFAVGSIPVRIRAQAREVNFALPTASSTSTAPQA